MDSVHQATVAESSSYQLWLWSLWNATIFNNVSEFSCRVFPLCAHGATTMQPVFAHLGEQCYCEQKSFNFTLTCGNRSGCQWTPFETHSTWSGYEILRYVDRTVNSYTELINELKIEELGNFLFNLYVEYLFTYTSVVFPLCSSQCSCCGCTQN